MERRSKEFEAHLRNHFAYPATKRQMIAACNNMSDIPAKDRKWFADSLPDKTYKNAGEVLKAIESLEAKSW